ncbi:MAG TPA: HypC/HybG/HupF family hydrogenase formation chaperone [Candidatus Dormibacteraeota bacterium]|nr:HypC/HybG/HupF family hydrogenase formation chaperone [Candidatus Dormibacteraeota bacterium]
MCISFPGRVVAVDEAGAVVEADGNRRRASTLLEPSTGVGDWVLVGAGNVLRRLDADEAGELIRTLTTARASTDARDALPSPGGPR